MDIVTLYNKLLDALTSGSLDALIKTAAEHLHQHIVVLDTSYNVLASYPHELIGDIYWDAQQQFGFVPEENLNMIFENKYPDATFKGIKYIDWGNVVFPRAVSSILHKGRSLGHVSIYHTDTSVSREDTISACECLEKLLRIHFINSEGIYLSSDAITSALVSKIFMGQQITPSLLTQWEKAVGCKLAGKYLLFAFPSKNIQFGKLEVIFGRMNGIHRYIAAAEINKYHYLLFYNIPSDSYAASICERLQDFLDGYKLTTGVSELFNDLSDIQSYMFQSRRALNTGLGMTHDSRILYYSSLLAEIMMSFIVDNIDSVNSTHPLLKALKADDAVNGTQYYETLITYLNCMCDSAVSAKALNIHRNTLLYRVNHIQESYSCSFNDMKLMRALTLSAYVCSYRQELETCEKSQNGG